MSKELKPGSRFLGDVASYPKGMRSPTGSVFCDWVLNRVTTKKKNCILLLVGEPGTGKSYGALKFGEQIMQAQGRKFDVDKHVFFSIGNFVQKLKNENFEKGDVIVLEEVGVEHSNRKWYDKAQILFNFILQTFRNKNLVILMTTPDYSFIDSQARKLTQGVVHFVERKPKFTIVQFKKRVNDPVSGKFFEKYLRYKKKKWLKSRKLEYFHVKKPSTESIRKYEKNSVEYKNEIISRAQEEIEPPKVDKRGVPILNKKQGLVLIDFMVNTKGMSIKEVCEFWGVGYDKFRNQVSALRKKQQPQDTTFNEESFINTGINEFMKAKRSEAKR